MGRCNLWLHYAQRLGDTYPSAIPNWDPYKCVHHRDDVVTIPHKPVGTGLRTVRKGNGSMSRKTDSRGRLSLQAYQYTHRQNYAQPGRGGACSSRMYNIAARDPSTMLGMTKGGLIQPSYRGKTDSRGRLSLQAYQYTELRRATPTFVFFLHIIVDILFLQWYNILNENLKIYLIKRIQNHEMDIPE